MNSAIPPKAILQNAISFASFVPPSIFISTDFNFSAIILSSTAVFWFCVSVFISTVYRAVVIASSG